MKFKRIKSKGGKKWKKGESGLCNPANLGYREKARAGVFSRVEGNSGLTEEALAIHNAALSGGVVTLNAADVDPEDYKSIGKSAKTFASDITTCTLPAFEKLFNNFQVGSELHTKMLAIHAAVQEYLREQDLAETPTSYLLAVLSSLEGIRESEDDARAALCLLSLLIGKVSTEVLQAKFGAIGQLLEEVFTQYQASKNVSLIGNLIGCLSVLLRKQDASVWSLPNTKHLLHIMMAYITDERFKVRKSAQYCVSAILKSGTQKEETIDAVEGADAKDWIHPASTLVARYVISSIRVAIQDKNVKTVLHLLVFLQLIIVCLPRKALKEACECVIAVLHVGDKIVNTCAFKVLLALFTSEPCPSRCTAEITRGIINILSASDATHGFSLIPGMGQPELCLMWMDIVTSAVAYLVRTDERNGFDYMAQWVKQLVPYWKSVNKDMQRKVTYCLEQILEDSIETRSNCLSSLYSKECLLVIESFQMGLSLQYECAWGHVFQVMGVLNRVMGPHFTEKMLEVIKEMAGLMNHPELEYEAQLERAIGIGVCTLGPERIVEVAPIGITGNIVEDEKSFWIIPLMRKYISGARIKFFLDYFGHLLSKCFVILNNLKQKSSPSPLLVKTYQNIENQIWSLLPSFAKTAPDIEEVLAQQSFAKTLADHLKIREDTRLDIMSALRNMIKAKIGKPGILSVYAKNYIPLLFNIYLTKPRTSLNIMSEEPSIPLEHRQAAFKTLVSFAGITSVAKVNEFSTLLINKYENATGDVFRRKSLLELARIFLPYVDVAHTESLYNEACKLIASPKGALQKSAYKVLEDLLVCSSENTNSFISSHCEDIRVTLGQIISTPCKLSQAARLCCLKAFVKHVLLRTDSTEVHQLLVKTVKETVACCSLFSPSNTRKVAFELLAEAGQAMQHFNDWSSDTTVKHMLSVVLEGLALSEQSACCTVLALTSLLFRYKGLIPNDYISVLVEKVLPFLLSKNKDLVNYSLIFLKSVFTLFSPSITGEFVSPAMHTIVASSLCQSLFRKRRQDFFCLLFQKFGSSYIRSLVPEKHKGLQKFLKNTAKTDAREKRKAEKKKEEKKNKKAQAVEEQSMPPYSLDDILRELDEDQEADMEVNDGGSKDRETEGKARTKNKTWIREDDEEEVIDLLDVSVAGAVRTKKPRERVDPVEKEKILGFPVDKESGKLIITGHKEKSRRGGKTSGDDDTPVMGLKRKRMLSESSDESTDEDDAKEAPKKRKKVKQGEKFSYGSEFRSKKASGDICNRDGVAPYAYVPLAKERLNRRKTAKFAGQFKKLVRGAQKGVAKGKKVRAKQRK